MRGTAAAAVKRALAEQVRRGFVADPQVSGVRVSYGTPGRIEREHMYLGAARFGHEPAGMGRVLARQETLTVTAHIYVRIPGGKQEEADARAVQIGTVLEQLLAGDPNFQILPEIAFARVTSGELDGGDDDDAVVAVLDYELTFRTTLR